MLFAAKFAECEDYERIGLLYTILNFETHETLIIL